MTDFFIGLVPDYGLYLIFICVFLACLAIPLPSSMLVLTAGGFAATGDLQLWHVLIVTFVAYLLGDQLAFGIAQRAGRPVIRRLEKSKRISALVAKSESMVANYGLLAIFISHTIVSPTAPYVSYVCGVNTMKWTRFSAVSSFSAALWTTGYVLLGYLFSGRLAQTSDLLIDSVLAVVAVIVTVLLIARLYHKWSVFQVSPV